MIHLHTVPEFIEPSPEKIYQKFHLLLSHYHADCVFVAKKLQYLVYFIFTTGPVSSTLSNAMKEFLCEQFQNYDDHFIALGAVSYTHLIAEFVLELLMIHLKD